jgi:hypothetical protein
MWYAVPSLDISSEVPRCSMPIPALYPGFLIAPTASKIKLAVKARTDIPNPTWTPVRQSKPLLQRSQALLGCFSFDQVPVDSFVSFLEGDLWLSSIRLEVEIILLLDLNYLVLLEKSKRYEQYFIEIVESLTLVVASSASISKESGSLVSSIISGVRILRSTLGWAIHFNLSFHLLMTLVGSNINNTSIDYAVKVERLNAEGSGNMS